MTSRQHAPGTVRAGVVALGSTDMSDPRHYSIQFEADELRDLLGRVQSSGDRLNTLLNDFQTMTHIEAGVAQREHDSMRQVVVPNYIISHVTNDFEKRAEERGLKLVFDMDRELPEINIASNQIVRALTCLFDNALKFNNENGSITIRTLKKTGEAAIVVEDEGVGIDSEYHTKVFDKFYQVQKELTQQKGAGLGLSIAKSLVEINGGRIDLESAPGKGSTFSIFFPAS